jgi:myo-inositol-1(or 4)-monophosphatase
LVTEADLASQQAIQRILLEAFPEHGFLGEEQEPTSPDKLEADSRWIVDPLDGTTNYVHGLPAFSVSIALEHRGDLAVGVIYDPVADECFTAAANRGAFLNGERIAVSLCQSLDQALAAASFSANVARDSEEVRRFLELLGECQAVRRLGSSALNLAYLAAGRLDAYWATSVKIWDVAAGVLLVREAGGVVTNVEGGTFDLSQPCFAAAATPPLHQQLVAALRRALS